VAILIALPTVVVEAAGSSWLPGVRWRMIYQFTIPLAYLAIAAGIVTLISRPLKSWLWAASVGALAGFAFLFSLATNQLGVTITRSERALRGAVASYIGDNLRAGLKPPFAFLVLDGPGFLWFSSDLLSDLYARTWFKGDDVSFRVIRAKAQVDIPSSQIITLAPDVVENARLWNVPMGYNHIYFLKADETDVRRVNVIRESDVKDYQIIWKRKQPIYTPE
jgi:hypothetical protein